MILGLGFSDDLGRPTTFHLSSQIFPSTSQEQADIMVTEEGWALGIPEQLHTCKDSSEVALAACVTSLMGTMAQGPAVSPGSKALPAPDCIGSGQGRPPADPELGVGVGQLRKEFPFSGVI
jgi:hypothetical protein